MAAKTSFWNKLPRPFFALAPMANVTDAVFRKLIAKYGKPDVFWTEFVSADGLVSEGRNKLLIDLKYSKNEKPIVAQLFGANPEKMFEAAKVIRKLGFDGLDINMGCPDRAVEKSGGGAAMIKSPKHAIEIIEAVKDVGIPISVKTRLGYNKIDFEWIELLLGQKLPALTVHLRTRKEMSKVPADWEAMRKIIQLRDEISPETLIIGNGDVTSLEDGLEKAHKYGCDGIMVGRGIFGKPWFFEDLKLSNLRHPRPLGDGCGLSSDKKPDYRLKIMLEHAKSFSTTFKGIKNFDTMKKHFKAYVSGWDGTKELRVKLMEAGDYREVKKIVDEYSRKSADSFVL